MTCPHCRQYVPRVAGGMLWHVRAKSKRLAQLHAAGKCRQANVSGSLQQRLERSIQQPWPADPMADRRDGGGRFTAAT